MVLEKYVFDPDNEIGFGFEHMEGSLFKMTPRDTTSS